MTDQLDLFGATPAGAVEATTAVLSSDGVYRYRLERRWAEGPALLWLLLNPSTADATEDDATIRKIRKFSKREGAAALTVVNLFAFRAKEPDDLRKADDPCGPDNQVHIVRALTEHHHVVFGWGAWCLNQSGRRGRKLKRLPVEVLAREAGRKPVCLGTTKHGEPCHPLYLADTTEMELWRPPGVGSAALQ